MANNNEIPKPLSAVNKDTFAYATIKDRLPVTITKAIDYLSRSRNELIERFSEEAADDCKYSIERLSQLRYELTTDKQFRPLTDNENDVSLWNNHLENLKNQIGIENCSWFKSPWLFAECYMYRRIREAMQLCQTDMKNYDPFEKSKIETCKHTQKSVSSLISGVCPLNYEEEEKNDEILQKRFHQIVQALLWSNKNDLSLSSGNQVSSKVENLFQLLESFEKFIISDHSDNLWKLLNELKFSRKDNKNVRIDIVLDNCAIELASDLLLCDFLLRNEFVDQIHLHAKSYAWFVSDVTKFDFDYLIRQFQSENSIIINKFQSRLKKYKEQSRLVLNYENNFWTSAYSYDQMKNIAPDLYSIFEKNSSLVILKGDLNYRKFIGDLDWPFETPLHIAVREFKPTSICAIRTLKSDLIAGLDTNESTNERYAFVKRNFNDNKWMVTGDYGLIQLLKI